MLRPQARAAEKCGAASLSKRGAFLGVCYAFTGIIDGYGRRNSMGFRRNCSAAFIYTQCRITRESYDIPYVLDRHDYACPDLCQRLSQERLAETVQKQTPPERFADLRCAALWAMHYTYYKSIEEGNAAAATVIQYTCPAMVILYESVRYWKRPGKCELLTVLMAVGGTFLLVTGGSLEKLSVPAACIVWGLLSAVFFAAVSIYPKHLLIQFSNEFLLTAGMFLGAGFSWILFPPISLSDFLTQPVLFDVSWIILFGTALAFICFNTGLARLKPAEASVTATVEPLAAVVFSYLLFDMTFGAVEW